MEERTLKEIEIPFGTKDSELCGWEYTIPEDYEAEIKDGKVIIRKAESEDEKIRKSLKDCFEWLRDDARWTDVYGSSFESIFAWIEKKGEQKTTWSKEDIELLNNTIKFIEDSVAAIPPSLRTYSPTLTGKEIPFLKALKDRVLPKQGWSEEDETTKNNISHIIRQYDKISKRENQPCWYVGDCLLWMQSIKDRVQPQLKQEWSEEDEKLYNDLSDTYFYNDEDYPEETYKLMLKRVLDWMTKRAKSLRPQSHWKPSDEQMAALADALSLAKNCGEESAFELRTLYEQIKKLREE